MLPEELAVESPLSAVRRSEEAFAPPTTAPTRAEVRRTLRSKASEEQKEEEEEEEQEEEGEESSSVCHSDEENQEVVLYKLKNICDDETLID